jgi:hypothetical protein
MTNLARFVVTKVYCIGPFVGGYLSGFKKAGRWALVATVALSLAKPLQTGALRVIYS